MTFGSPYAQAMIDGKICVICDKNLTDENRIKVVEDRCVCSERCKAEFIRANAKFHWGYEVK